MLRRSAAVRWLRSQLQSSLGFKLKENEQWGEAAKWFSRSRLSRDIRQAMVSERRRFLLYRGRGVPQDRSARHFRLMLEDRAQDALDLVSRSTMSAITDVREGTFISERRLLTSRKTQPERSTVSRLRTRRDVGAQREQT